MKRWRGACAVVNNSMRVLEKGILAHIEMKSDIEEEKMDGRLIVFLIIMFAFVIICSACAQIWTPYNDPNINAQVTQALNKDSANEGTKTLSQTEYDGVATVSIEYWDYDAYGNLVYQNTGSYQRNVKISVSRPEICGSLSESNPLHLEIDTDLDPANPMDADFSIYSGGSFSHPSGGCVLLQYWQLTGSASSFQGTLTDTHSAEANVRNMLWTKQQIAPGVDMVSFSSIEKGTILQGKIDDQRAQIKIQGNSVSRTRPFVADIIAYEVK